MKQRFFTYILLSYFLIPVKVLAADSSNVLGISDNKIRTGNITITDIPQIILNAINFFMSFAGGIAVIMVIVGAYQILFGSLSSDKSKGKRTIYLALSGFALASLAWVIVKFIIDNFS